MLDFCGVRVWSKAVRNADAYFLKSWETSAKVWMWMISIARSRAYVGHKRCKEVPYHSS
jgi:hypothetical protein